MAELGVMLNGSDGSESSASAASKEEVFATGYWLRMPLRESCRCCEVQCWADRPICCWTEDNCQKFGEDFNASCMYFFHSLDVITLGDLCEQAGGKILPELSGRIAAALGMWSKHKVDDNVAASVEAKRRARNFTEKQLAYLSDKVHKEVAFHNQPREVFVPHLSPVLLPAMSRSLKHTYSTDPLAVQFLPLDDDCLESLPSQGPSSSTLTSSERVIDEQSDRDEELQLTCLPASLQGQSIWKLAQTKEGSKKVQEAVKNARCRHQRQRIAKGFRGHVWKAAMDDWANFALQAIILLSEPKVLQFIIDELLMKLKQSDSIKKLCVLVKNKYGNRVVECLMKNCSSDQLGELGESLLADAPELAMHRHANFPIQGLCELEGWRERLADRLVLHIERIGRNFYGSKVLMSVLQSRSPKAQVLAKCLLNRPQLRAAILGQPKKFSYGVELLELAKSVDQRWVNIQA